MKHSHLHPSKKWFTILIALWTIGILLIIVTSLASIYINEMKLSRLQYNNILAYAQADWVFEYAMLKVANHRDGFQDVMLWGDPDSSMFSGSTPRTENTSVRYTIESQSRDQVFTLSGWSHLILPLFSGTGNTLAGSRTSIDPRYTDTIQKISALQLQWVWVPTLNELSWSIVALSGSENIGVAWTGTIDPLSTRWVMRLHGIDCYDQDGNKWTQVALDQFGNCTGIYSESQGWETVEYTYDTPIRVSDFLWKTEYQNPYLLLYNGWVSDVSIHVVTDRPFPLPVIRVYTEARKWNSMQSIEYREDKSKYYDALRYGIYSN